MKCKEHKMIYLEKKEDLIICINKSANINMRHKALPSDYSRYSTPLHHIIRILLKTTA